jgi:unsaturated rhamnogalacturonyl hydrolase
MRNYFKILIFILLLQLVSFSILAQSQRRELQIKTQPAEVGKKLVDYIAEKRFGWRYQKVCTYYGSLIFADAIHDAKILETIQEGYSPFLKGSRKNHIGHVDYNVFGIWPFEMYRQTGNHQYLETAKHLADDEYKIPRPDSLSSYTRFWVDDMYMVGSLQAQAFKSLKDTVYLNRAARQLVAYCEKLQRTNGLFYHRDDAPFYWGRGNGWAAAAMAEVLPILPEDNKYFPPLMKAYLKMMEVLIQYQGKDGMWHQLLDDQESFAETSCTGMFLFSMATGLEKGWLSFDKYGDGVQNAWNALVGFVNEKGAVREVCVGTNAKNSKRHYLKRPRSTGNFHGQAAVLWAATAMVRLAQKQSN